MRTTLRGALITAALLTVAKSHAADPKARFVIPNEDPIQIQAYIAADGLIKAHQPQAAIDRYLDPVIAYYQRTYGGIGVKIYCAHSSTESLRYLLLSAAAKQDSVVMKTSTWADALAERAYALVDLGRIAEAKTAYEAALALSPESWAYLAELGHIAQLEHDWRGSLALFDHVDEAALLVTGPEQLLAKGRALRGRGYALSELGRYDDAEAAYRNALALDPNDKVAQGELLYIARKRGKGTPIKS